MFEDDGSDDADIVPDDPAEKFPEPSPEAVLPDPENELPNIPEAPTPSLSESDAPAELRRGFWATVLIFNVALLALSVGALLVIFNFERTLGAGLFIVGVFSFVRGYLKYQSLKERDWSEEIDEKAASEATNAASGPETQPESSSESE